MSKLKSVNTYIWGDVWFEGLGVKEKLLFIYLITNEKNNMLGAYEISLNKISFETSIPMNDVKKGFSFFEKENKIQYKHNRVILMNYLKHQKYNSNMKKSAIDSYNNLPKELKIKDEELIPRNDKGFETLCKGFGNPSGMVRKIEVEVEVESESEISISSKEKNKEKFLKWFNSKKKELYYKTKSGRKFKTLSPTAYKNLMSLKKAYDQDDFNSAIPALFKNKWAIENNALTPEHFLVMKNFERYLSADNLGRKKVTHLKQTKVDH